MKRYFLLKTIIQFLFIGFLLNGTLSACTVNQRLIPAPSPIGQSQTTPTTVLPGTPSPSSSLPECLNNLSHREEARVTAITDGDTIHVNLNGQEMKVRYVGIDTPEIHDSLEYYGPEASRENAALVADKTVTLFKDHSNTDRFGRLLRYIVVDGVFVNLTLVRQGYAYAKDYKPDTTCSQELHAAEDQARRDKLGVWGKP